MADLEDEVTRLREKNSKANFNGENSHKSTASEEELKVKKIKYCLLL